MSELRRLSGTMLDRVRDELLHGHVGWSFLTLFMVLVLSLSVILPVLMSPVGLLALAAALGWAGLCRSRATRRGGR